MSLLEDVFLQNEADEAQDLERVIEGDEFDDGPRQRSDSENDSVRGDDEAEEEKQRVDPQGTKQPKIVKNPRFVLNPARLTGPRGIQIIPEHFKDFKFKGKGHEKEDLDMVLKKLEHWAYRLYPKFQFDDCLKKIETLGKKRTVMVHLHKIRSDQYQTEETVVQRDSSDDEVADAAPEVDEFDKLLQQQIEIARMTPTPNSAKKPGFSTPAGDIGTPFTMPKATSSPSINEEQRERMLRNRRLAEERRLAKLKQPAEIVTENTTEEPKRKLKSNVIESEDDEDDMKAQPDKVLILEDNDTTTNSKMVHGSIDLTNIEIDPIITGDNDNFEIIDTSMNSRAGKTRKHNRSNIIDSSDSSDDECGVTTMNQSIMVDVHKTTSNDVASDKVLRFN